MLVRRRPVHDWGLAKAAAIATRRAPPKYLVPLVNPLLVVLAWCVGVAAGTAATPPMVVGCVGDFGSDYVTTRMVANLVKSWQPHFVITLGDNNYPSGAAATLDRNVGQFYHEFIAPYTGRYGAGAVTNRFFPSLGNHDWLATNAQPYLDYFSLPGNERYYSLRFREVELFCIDSDKKEPDGATADSAQGRWLRQGLLNSQATWRIVYFHHAPYSSGYYHGTLTGETAHMRWPFHEWGADAVLAGHDHIYERIHTNGLVYLVNGLGGDSKDRMRGPFVPGSVKRFSGDFGALRIDANENYLLFRFLTWRGNLIDSYRMTPEQRLPRPLAPAK